MANLVITVVPDTNRFLFTSNDAFPDKVQWEYDFVWADQIEDVHKNGHIALVFRGGRVLELTFDGANGTIKVDSVLTVSPTDDDHLATLIADLKG